MEYIGFRFFSASENWVKNVFLGRNLWYIDRETEKDMRILEWAKQMEGDLKDLQEERDGTAARNEKRVTKYHKAVIEAFYFAMRRSFDIVASDDDGEFAMIVLQKDALLLFGKEKEEDIELLSWLAQCADEAYFTPWQAEPETERLCIQFVFDLCDTVKA